MTAKLFPALTVRWQDAVGRADLVLAELDGTGVTAVEDLPCGMRVYFASAAARDKARARLTPLDTLTAEDEDIADDDWAERSQAAMDAVSVGQVVVSPPWRREAADAGGARHVIVVQPSMGFGTGHHATTRLCLGWLQQVPLRGAHVFDAGTGSGVLAMAAVVLGASASVGADFDLDALASARENLQLNSIEDRVSLVAMDLTVAPPLDRRFDVVVANLTGALLARTASALFALAAPRARLIASGYQTYQDAEVSSALAAAGWQLAGHAVEDDWVGALFLRDVTMTSPTTSRAL